MDLKHPFAKQTFEISAKDARRVCDALELSADFDKTEIYYKLRTFLKEISK